jgi:hypothetical protein
MSDFVLTFNEAELAAILADFYAASNDQRSNDFSSGSQSLLNVVNVAIAPPLPTVDNLQPTINFATATVGNSVAESGPSESNIVVTLLETLDDAGDLAGYVALQRQPAVWFGTIQVIMNGLTDAQRTIINSLDIGSQVSVTKTFPNSTPSTVTQLMALEGISHDITPDRHIVTLYPNPARIYTYFIVGGYPVVATRTNLVPNPNFEVDVLMTENTAPGGSSLARSTAQAYLGSASCAGSTGGTGGNLIFGTMASSSRIAATAGTVYTGSLYARSAAVSRTAYARLLFYDAAGTGLSTTNGTSAATSTTAWSRYTVTATAPANTATVLLQIVIQGTSTTETHYIDGLLLEAAASALPYFDGTYVDNYTGYGLNSKTWNGTANASTSTATWYQGATRTNLLTNPNFETNTTTYTGLGASVLSRVSTSAYVGSYSMLVTDTSTGYAGSALSFTPTSGTTYTASCYVKNTAGLSRTMYVRIGWSGGTDSTGSLVTVPVGSDWTRISVTAAAPNSSAATIYFVTSDIGSTETAELALIDAALLEVASSALPYFDGTYADAYTGYTLTSQAWSGTADASTSTATWGLTSSFVGSQLNDDTKGLG